MQGSLFGVWAFVLFRAYCQGLRVKGLECRIVRRHALTPCCHLLSCPLSLSSETLQTSAQTEHGICTESRCRRLHGEELIITVNYPKTASEQDRQITFGSGFAHRHMPGTISQSGAAQACGKCSGRLLIDMITVLVHSQG